MQLRSGHNPCLVPKPISWQPQILLSILNYNWWQLPMLRSFLLPFYLRVFIWRCWELNMRLAAWKGWCLPHCHSFVPCRWPLSRGKIIPVDFFRMGEIYPFANHARHNGIIFRNGPTMKELSYFSQMSRSLGPEAPPSPIFIELIF